MRRPPSVLTLLLALCIVFGTTVAAAQSSTMAVKMATTATSLDGAQGHCDDCGSPQSDNACASLCAAQAPFVIPVATVAYEESAARDLVTAANRSMQGRTASPDPGPPRSFVISV
jgi:hypothetical protein